MTAIESQESSSPIVTRAVAAGLRGEYTENYQLPGWQKTLLTGVGALPQGAGVRHRTGAPAGRNQESKEAKIIPDRTDFRSIEDFGSLIFTVPTSALRLRNPAAGQPGR